LNSKHHKKISSTKRLDGKKILVSLTSQLEEDIYSYCRERGIESQNEFIRQAIAKYLDSDYEDNTLKLISLKNLQEKLSELYDMVSILFSYQHMMHLNTLAYHPEIAHELTDAAFASATNRLEKFFASFRERLRDDPAFFEKLLHIYVTGS